MIIAEPCWNQSQSYPEPPAFKKPTDRLGQPLTDSLTVSFFPSFLMTVMTNLLKDSCVHGRMMACASSERVNCRSHLQYNDGAMMELYTIIMWNAPLHLIA